MNVLSQSAELSHLTKTQNPTERRQMKRTTNSGVISAWSQGEAAINSRASLRTDGASLWSYNLLIGERTTFPERDQMVLADYTAATGNFKSQTTSCHIGLARRVANVIMAPEVF